MKTFIKTSFIIVTLIYSQSVVAQTCGIPGKDNDNLSLNGEVNTFWTPTNGTYDSSTSSITLSNRRGVATDISSGDLVLVIQMQCANIDFSDTDAYGDGIAGDTSFGSPIASGYIDPVGSCLAGQYEFVRAGPASSSSSLDLSQNSLVNTYVQAEATASLGRRTFQIIRVPQYDNVTLTGNLTTVNWNGFSGGVIVLDVAGTLNLNNNNIDVNGHGFRGGGGRTRNANDPNTRYRWDVDDRHASKGEGIVSTPRFVSNKISVSSTAGAGITDLGGAWLGYPDGVSSNGNFARGAPGNAGGGGAFWDGRSDNGGGGGGGNGGAGGRGGAGWRSASIGGYSGIDVNYSNHPEKKWGFGGSSFAQASISRVVMGGGGGAGDNNNNSVANLSSGAAGGGIVMIRARQVQGTGSIFARGARAADNNLNDGAGAGGAGGSVIIVSSDLSTATITVNAQGGVGGNAWLGGTTAHGAGGGGGGGVVLLTGAATVDVTGGANGLTTTADNPPDGASHGAKSGSNGQNQAITVESDVPGVNTGFRCRDYGDAASSYGLAGHNLDAVPENLHLGALLPDGDRSVLTAIPSANAITDDNSDTNDEDGVSLPATSTLAGEYTATTTVFNNSGSVANLCGWMDFDQDGVFQVDEAVCTTVPSSASSQTVNLVFTVPADDRTNSGQIVGRFRLSTDTLTTSSSTGNVSNGEVEDHIVNITTLPVSVHHFSSRVVGKQLEIKWSTSSETRNIGFNIWAYENDQLVKLNKNLIQSKSEGALKVQHYTSFFENKTDYQSLAITAVDNRGKEELFGMYEFNKSYGKDYTPEKINWKVVKSRLLKYEQKQRQVQSSQKQADFSNQHKVLLKTSHQGMQSISFDDFVNAGIDLSNYRHGQLAITRNGQPISRYVGAKPEYSDTIFDHGFDLSTDFFKAGESIYFWSEKPDFPDAKYIDFYTYELVIDTSRVKQASNLPVSSSSLSSFYQSRDKRDENKYYSFTAQDEDPWYAKRLLNFSNEAAKVYDLRFDVKNKVEGLPGLLKVNVSGGTSFEENPDHEVSLVFNNQVVLTQAFDGLENLILEAQIPQQLLHEGENIMQVKLTDGSLAQYDVVLVDTVELSYPKVFDASSNEFLLESQTFEGALQITNQTAKQDMLAFGFVDNELYRLQTQALENQTTAIATISSKSVDYWVSKQNQIHTPVLQMVEEKQNLVSANTEFLIIAHPLFIPLNDNPSHPLNQFIQSKQQQGWNTQVVSIKDIQEKYSSGMNLPVAVTKLLQEHTGKSLSHILLAGGDTYDYKNYLGLGSVSFIPTTYSSTLFIPHTPSDALLTDQNNDGLADYAIGRWPIRTMEDLASIVQKTLLWESNSNGEITAVVVADVDDSQKNFESQASRFKDKLMQSGWLEQNIVEILPNQPNENSALINQDQVRQKMFAEWEKNKTFTSFIGHGSPSQWSRRGILSSSDLLQLNNVQTPVMIGTLTCYTSYFVSPEHDSLSNNLLNGVNQTANGAVAVHGAITLSSFGGNETFSNLVTEQMSKGKTLGQAILMARQKAGKMGFTDHVKNWTLLGDPTLKMATD